MITVLKLGGELLEDRGAMNAAAAAVRRLARREPLVIVHGGGRAIDAELRARGIEPRFVDGVRVTDGPTLDVVVSVLAGRTNTAFVAALQAADVRAVGLTGADAGIGLSTPVSGFASAAGAPVDLGDVGRPVETPVTLLHDLVALGYVPVVSSIGVTADGALLNVNADTLAAHLAGSLRARRLIIAGGTAGVLDGSAGTIDQLTLSEADEMIAAGTAHSGMIAKLVACREALTRGVRDVRVVGGRDADDYGTAPGTAMTAVSLTPVSLEGAAR